MRERLLAQTLRWSKQHRLHASRTLPCLRCRWWFSSGPVVRTRALVETRGGSTTSAPVAASERSDNKRNCVCGTSHHTTQTSNYTSDDATHLAPQGTESYFAQLSRRSSCAS